MKKQDPSPECSRPGGSSNRSSVRRPIAFASRLNSKSTVINRQEPMKTNTPNALYKLLTLIVAAFTMNLTTYSLWAAEAVPFKGIVQGTTVGVAPDPAGVTLT